MMPKIQVAHIGGHSYFNPQGGIDFILIELSKRLSAHNVKTVFYARDYLCHNKKQLDYVEEIPSFCLKIKYLEILSYALISSLKVCKSNVEIVHYHTLWAGLFSFIPRLFGKKVIVSCHALEWDRGWNPLVKTIMRILDWISLLYNKELIVISKPLYHYYKKIAKKVVYIPNGVTMPSLHKNEKREKIILFCSRLVPEKGAHYLIEAFQKLEKDLKNYTLYICGASMHTDSYVRELKKMAAKNKNIIFPGHVLDEKKHGFFSNASIYVLPSEIEGMSISLLEAMSYGVPTLVSDIKENKNLAKDNCFYFKSKDAESLKKALTHMLKNPQEAKERAYKAKIFVSKNYDVNIIAEKYYHLYRNLQRGV